jgi:hypothetical protein
VDWCHSNLLDLLRVKTCVCSYNLYATRDETRNPFFFRDIPLCSNNSSCIYDSRDSSRQPSPSPSLCYSLTHAHRSIGYRNHNPQPLSDSAARLMHLRVHDNRDNSHQSAHSPSLCYSLTHAHSTLPTPTLITITCTQVLWFLERLTRPTVSCCETTRTRLTICLPVQALCAVMVIR